MTAKTKRIDLVDPPKPLVFEESKPFEDQDTMPVIVNLSTEIESYPDSVKMGAKISASFFHQYTDRRTASMKDVLLAMRAMLDAEISKLS